MSGAIDRARAEAEVFDDDALVSLGNRGLLRRAARLVEGAPATVTTADEDVEVGGDGWRVVFAAGAPLTKGRCGCATAGVCPHLIAAILVLRGPGVAAHGSAVRDGSAGFDGSEGFDASAAGDVTEAAVDGPTILEGLVGLGEDELRRWAGVAALRWAVDRAAGIGVEQVSIVDGAHVAITLPAPLPLVRFMGRDLDAAIVDPSGANDPRVVVLAVLCAWQSRDRALPEVARPVAVDQLVAERRLVVDAVAGIAADAVRQGLLHLGAPFVQALDAHAASARGARLYRLATLTDRVVDHIEAIDAHSTVADAGELLRVLSELHTVAGAIGDAIDRGTPVPDALAGSARAAYEPVGALALVGLGHRPWGDPSFGGTTAVVAEVGGRRVFTVTSTTQVRGRRQELAIGWQDGPAAPRLAGSRFRLTEARVSSALRISTSAATGFHPAGSFAPDDLGGAAWDGALPHPPSRLRAEPGARWVVVAVDEAEPEAVFDPVAQRVQWLVGAAGRPLLVELRYGAHTATAVEALLRWAPDRPSHVIGRLRVEGEPVLDPISLVVGGRLVVLADLHAAGAGRRPPGAEPVLLAGDHLDGAADHHLARVGAEVERWAERGTARLDPADLERLARRAADRGYGPLGLVLGDRSSPVEVRVLRGSWVLSEYRAVDADTVPVYQDS